MLNELRTYLLHLLTPDQINGLFEAFAGAFIFNHCWTLWQDKQVKGVSVLSTSFFFSWGLWNLYYYPNLNQLWSFLGGLVVVTANFSWLGMMIYYRKHPGGAAAVR